MQLRQSERKQAKIKMALQGSSGCGKSLSSLLLAKGLSNGNLAKVAVIDTENGSADLYAHLGDYNVLQLQPPFTPEKYIEAIEVCEKAGMEVIILDSISQVWDELLDFHSKLPGNSFANWSKVTPRQKAFINKILQADVHVIATMRTKQDYVLQLKDGKYVPEKVGLKAVQRDDVSYEFTIVFDIDIKHFAVASKDRTNLFSGKPEFMINTSTGKRILDWCTSPIKEEDVKLKIEDCLSVSQLLELYKEHPSFQLPLKASYQAKKDQLEKLTNPQNFSQNGNSISNRV
ncbi:MULTISPECIES: AAA family ATPase [Bizionia]|uniref:AAA family ATPase n=1 Tax=Bizionia algoritergicola TaxID=291187 RepID=A0A5D0R242_9FLAO|nr:MULTISPECIES: AAA family ATPase [Bizionia]OBX21548.1 AAA family ATPase [Bizionia sp. APA-3]TYB75139.1 AAA family ATPase [Bizionia algoritergicola]